MANLKKFTLSYDDKKEDWKLTNDKTDRTVKRFENKSDATKGGVLKGFIGQDGGSVKIQKKESKRFQEERTYPRSADPKNSKG